MLKEVYVIEDGVHLFHYSLDDSEHDNTNLTLASGFLSAIQSFSQETKDSSIDYFSLENEFFLFDFLPWSNKHVVAIYNKSIEASVAREMLKHIVKEIKESQITKLSQGLTLSPRDENKLKTARGLISLKSGFGKSRAKNGARRAISRRRSSRSRC